ncbi:MAG: APC family permease [Anaerolineae bacterium]
MTIIDEESRTTVLVRPTNYKPPRSLSTWLLGRPLPTADAPHQTISKKVGLAVFASDALSSTAYATQEMMVMLASAGVAAFSFAFPISIAIVALLAIVTISYEQTIHAYPNGGGSYIVSFDNLGEWPAMVAGAALLTDYILTVAVSVSSGVAQITSAFPDLFPWRVVIALVLVFFVMLVNLRGVKESGTLFAIPTYFFVVMMFATVGIGLFRYFTGTLGQVVNPPEMEVIHGAQALTFFLLLKAFSSGTSALTGVEAISNGIPAFSEPKSRNAGITLIWMSTILGILLLAITFLSYKIGAVPSAVETVISQLARTVYDGSGLLYFLMIAATTVILIMATNTSFADFPRLSALLAGDGFLPRYLAFRGSRLVFSRGILFLAFVAAILIIIFRASVTSLIPLYAIGVFLSFTLSQAGMARRWWKTGKLTRGEPVEEVHAHATPLHPDPSWQIKMAINTFGAVLTAIIAVIFAVTKFSDGAWVVLILIPAIVFVFRIINKHYRTIASSLSLNSYAAPPGIMRKRVILPVSGVHQGTLQALRFARSLSNDVTAVHVSVDPEQMERIKQKWDVWGEGVRLVILESPYRLLHEPLMDYIASVAEHRQPNELIVVAVPEFVPQHWWQNLLHTQAALTLRFAFRSMPGVVIMDVPYQINTDQLQQENSLPPKEATN